MRWKVTGGKETGGILVRKERKLGSEETDTRLAFGSIVEEVELHGERLHYKLVDGTGPEMGWVSVALKNKELLTRLQQEKGQDLDQGRAKEQAPEQAQEELSDNEFARVEHVGGPGDFASDVDENFELQALLMGEARSKELDGSEILYFARLHKTIHSPRLRILCFPSEGSAGSVFTVPGTSLVNWAEQQEIEVCAFDYPGRGALVKVSPHTSAQDLAKDLVAASLSKLRDGIPYIIWGHSVGTWIAFEFLMLCRKIAMPMPRACFLMAFPAPHCSPNKRQWSSRTKLTDDRLKSELILWDEVHFTGHGKLAFGIPDWMKLMHADRKLFGKYVFSHDGAPKFNFPIHAWHFKCKNHNFIDQSMVDLWRDWTTGEFETRVVEHLEHIACLYSIERKQAYFNLVTEMLRAEAALLS